MKFKRVTFLFRFSDYFPVKYQKNNTVCHDKSAKYGSFTVPVKNAIECAIICLYYYPNTTYIDYHNSNTTTSVANGWTVYSVKYVVSDKFVVLIRFNATCASTNDGERQNLSSFKDCAIYCDSSYTNRIVSSRFIKWKARKVTSHLRVCVM